jgi:hypothetical protein
MDRITRIHNTLLDLEEVIIAQTKETIDKREQEEGKQLLWCKHDAEIIIESSNQFFTLIHEICCKVGLASIVPIIQSNSFKTKRDDVVSEKIMPGVLSCAISKQIDDTGKRLRSIHQSICILIKTIIETQRHNNAKLHMTWTNKLVQNIKRFMKHQEPFIDLMT